MNSIWIEFNDRVQRQNFNNALYCTVFFF